MKLKKILGIDFGGSGIKGAIVNTKTGELESDRHRIPTPSPSTPDSVAKVIKEIADFFSWDGAIGIGFPAVIQNGIALSAANIDKGWINTNVNNHVSKITGLPTYTVNDADAAGLAEMKFGAGKDNKGTIFLLTVGTGIGSVIFSRGKLVPNTELGHIIMPNCKEGEEYSSDATRKNEDLSWDDWAKRFDEYLNYIEALFWPDLFIIGGGASKKQEKFFEHLTVKAKIVPAQLLNNAGIVGAALAAKMMAKAEKS